MAPALPPPPYTWLMTMLELARVGTAVRAATKAAAKRKAVIWRIMVSFFISNPPGQISVPTSQLVWLFL